MTRPVIPQIVLVRVATSGGPYRVGETLSVAYVEASAGRLLAHEPAGTTPLDERDAMLPETISAVVIRAAEPFASGETLAFAFVDPAFARIHRVSSPPPRGYVERRDPMRSLPEGDSARAGNAATHMAPTTVTGPATSAVSSTSLTSPRNELSVPRTVRDAAEPPVRPRSTPPSELVATAAIDDDARLPDPIVVESSLGVSRTTIDSPPSGLTDGDRVSLGDAAAGSDGDDGASPSEVWSAFDEPADAASAGSDAESGPGVGRLAEATYRGLLLRCQWSDDRARRVAQVATRLFAIDRLGWFRHTLAIRLLLADDIACVDPIVEREAVRQLQAVRAAATEALGRPLLAASMPNFTVSAAWLESIETPATARALAGLRNAIVTSATDDRPPASREPRRSLGAIGRSELAAAPAGSIDALFPLLITTEFADGDVTAAARAYRQEALDAFAQVADASETVRLNAMARPNRALDDRLSVLVRAIGEAHDGLAVA